MATAYLQKVAEELSWKHERDDLKKKEKWNKTYLVEFSVGYSTFWSSEWSTEYLIES